MAVAPPKPCSESEKDLAVIKIGTVSQMTGLSASALRRYEEYGLVLPYKESGGQRLYSLSDINTLVVFQRAMRANKVGLAALSLLVRSVPLQSLRMRRCREIDCQVKNELGKKACWEVNANDSEWRRACRMCPSYQERLIAVEFHEKFHISLRPDRTKI